jgi:hypothetical protein
MSVAEVIIAVTNLQCTSKLPERAVIGIFDVISRTFPEGVAMLPSYYKLKQMMPAMGSFTMSSVDVCINGCAVLGPSVTDPAKRMLDDVCPRCKAPRYSMRRPQKVSVCIIDA